MAIKSPLAFFSPLLHRMIGEEEGGRVRPLMLDAVLREVEEHSNTMTEHPIEVPRRATGEVRRGRVADHVFREPTTYEMTAIVSDFPITWINFQEYGNSVLATRSQGAYDLLIQHHETGEPFELVTRWGKLPNMVLLNLSIENDKTKDSVLEFTAEIREAQIVIPPSSDSERSSDEVEGEQAETGAVSEINQGAAIGGIVTVSAIASVAAVASLREAS